MVRLHQKMLLLAANLLIPLGALVFMTGYFRGRPSTQNPPEVAMNRESIARSAPFDKSQLVAYSSPPRLIRSGTAMPFTARAASPTLTMSRIKAMTQGTSQSFLDLWLNIANSPNAARQHDVDTWLSRLKKEKDVEKKMVYYGTKTWLMLYPEIFDRHDGVDSYYVPDFTIVDQNITRHVSSELQKDDWKALVMHFPGLDHLAHQGGPYSAHMRPKQKELDGVVQEIYEAIEQRSHMQDTLFVLLGDHGMNEKGNHGGSAPGEIASALTFISPKFKSISKGLQSPVTTTKNYEYYSVIEQVDIVPILSGLLGFSIPVNSLGIFVSDFVQLFQKPDDGVDFLLRNARQMMNLFETKANLNSTMEEVSSCDSTCSGCHTDKSDIVCLWKKVSHAGSEWEISNDAASVDELIRSIDAPKFSHRVQDYLSIPLNNLHTTRLLVGITALTMTILLLIIGIALSHIKWDSGILAFGLLVGIHARTMFISELVEEEHHYWYWASLAWTAYLGFKSIRKGHFWVKAFIPVMLQYLTQCWNQSGDTTYPIVDTIHDILFENPLLLWNFALVAYTLWANSMATHLGTNKLLSRIVSFGLCLVAVVFKICATQRDNPELLIFTPDWVKNSMLGVDQTQLLRMMWICMFGCLVYLIARLKLSTRASRIDTLAGVINLANLYLMSQSKPKNLVLYPIFNFQLQWLLSRSSCLTPSEISLSALVLAQSSFYSIGGSNSVASLDITNGFNGIQGYNVTAVFLQTVLSNWVGPVWWTLAGLRNTKQTKVTANSNGKVHLSGNGTTRGNRAVSAKDVSLKEVSIRATSPKNKSEGPLKKDGEVFFEYLTFQTFYTASSSLAVMLACVWLRDDPSLWTVLAPKYVYVGLWTVFQQLLINFGLCTSIWRVVA
ncbi:alkaline phosphatase-like protein [Hypoxylon sp. NC1633]|nr:alkaline phosphatase-like protein [Hypoxylon sp. NC1633]